MSLGSLTLLGLASLGEDDASGVFARIVSGGLPIQLCTAALMATLLVFLLRPEWWRRLWLEDVDPRPLALVRIGLGCVILMNLGHFLQEHPATETSMLRFLFTEEGLWPTAVARAKFGGKLAQYWDPEYGFESWRDLFGLATENWSIFHFTSTPRVVFSVFVLLVASAIAMIFGVFSRISTLMTWVLFESFMRHNSIYQTGGDTAIRVFLFLGVFSRWGEAYSWDGLRRRTRAFATTGMAHAQKPIPVWPARLMMIQLAIIYCATGFFKSGTTWSSGTALYYAMNLEHFYRWPQTRGVAVAHMLGILPAMTIVVLFWERAFPLALIGAAVRGMKSVRRSTRGWWSRVRTTAASTIVFIAVGLWSAVAGLVFWTAREGSTGFSEVAVRHALLTGALGVGLVAFAAILSRWERAFPWIFGRRLWLGLGVATHVGIDVVMNVGTFSNVMLVSYAAWLRGEDIDRVVAWGFRQPVLPGEGKRPVRRGVGHLIRPWDRARHRVARPVLEVMVGSIGTNTRALSRLRALDSATVPRLRFSVGDGEPERGLAVRVAPGVVLTGDRAVLEIVDRLLGWSVLRWVTAPRAGRSHRLRARVFRVCFGIRP